MRGLVYCSCGAKMHAAKSQRKGHTYHYFACSKKCGARQVRMDILDKAAYAYLKNLLSEETQHSILEALREYSKTEKDSMAEFKAVLKMRIKEKEEQYNALLQNLSSGALPPAGLTDIGEKMQKIKEEIESLKATEPPKEFATPVVLLWLENLKNHPDDEAVRLLIERIDVKSTTDFNMHSTLKSVVGKIGCGGRI